MATLLTKGKQQAIDQASCGSGAENQRFTSQLAEQFPSRELIPPLAETEDIFLASGPVS
jgi:hypothetical protein